MVEHLSDDEIRNLSRGGHDYRKVYAAFKAATEHVGQPTVILAHTIKGWTLGPDFEARNATHQMKKLTVAELKEFRDRLYLEIPDSALEAELPPYYHPGEKSDEIQYMQERRAALGGYLPRRVVRARPLPLPEDKVYEELRKGSGKQAVATTMAFVRLLKDLMRAPGIGERFVPIIPDEARTFGMDSLFPTAKIYDPHGQTYEAVDRTLLLSYKEAVKGQILHEGISEAGAMGSMIAAGTSYATHGTPMIPVYIFYSMFGFQRTGDQMWALGDQLGRGFLLGATAGRTTLTGEGLQHNDGHSVLLASVSPACVAYDAAYAYELSYIVKDALRRMYGVQRRSTRDGEDIFYYLTVYNEPYVQPPVPDRLPRRPGGAGARHPARPVPVRATRRPADGTGPDGRTRPSGPRAQILASGVALRWALDAQRLLAQDWGVAAEAWSATSWTELRRDALACEEWNMLQPEGEPRVPYVTAALEGHPGPVVAVSDWIRAVPDQIARWVPGPFASLGTDGWGFSDTRPGGPPVLPRGRRVDHRRGAGPARQAGRGQARGGQPGHHQVPAGHVRQRRAQLGGPASYPDARWLAVRAAAAASLRPLRHRSFALLWGGRAGVHDRHLDAGRRGRRPADLPDRAGHLGGAGRGGRVPADRAAVPGGRRAGRPGAPAAGADRREPGRRGRRGRAGRPGRRPGHEDPALLVGAGRRPGRGVGPDRAVPAGDPARPGAAVGVPARHRAELGPVEPGPDRRPGAGRRGHRRVRLPAGVRRQRGLVPGRGRGAGCSSGFAPPAGPAGERLLASLRGGPARRPGREPALLGGDARPSAVVALIASPFIALVPAMAERRRRAAAGAAGGRWPRRPGC